MNFEDLRSSLTLPTAKHFVSPSQAPAEIRELEKRRNRCLHAKDYKAAQHLENRLNELKCIHEDSIVQELEAHQAEERAASDATFQQARQNLLQEWHSRIMELQGQLQEAEQQLLARQDHEASNLLAAQSSVQQRPKFSPALLNMRHIERTLAFQKEFAKAEKVKAQADQQELLELSQLGAERASKVEAERVHLATQHVKEREAAAKKAMSALLAAHQRQEYELEQLTRRHQAIKLSLSRTHAAQRLSIQQNLRGTLGLAKPTHLLGLPSFNSSLTETRSLVPDSPTKYFGTPLPQEPCAVARSRSPLGASGLYASPGTAPPSSTGTTSVDGRLIASAHHCCSSGSGCDIKVCRCAAAADAMNAAAGYGISMPPLTAHGGSRIGALRSGSTGPFDDAAKPCKQPAGQSRSSSPARPFTRAGGSRSLGVAASKGSPTKGTAGRGSSETKLPAAAGATGAVHPSNTDALVARIEPRSLPCNAGDSRGTAPDAHRTMDLPTTQLDHGKLKPSSAAASSPAGSTNSDSSLSPWAGTPAERASTAMPRSRFEYLPSSRAGAQALGAHQVPASAVECLDSNVSTPHAEALQHVAASQQKLQQEEYQQVQENCAALALQEDSIDRHQSAAVAAVALPAAQSHDAGLAGSQPLAHSLLERIAAVQEAPCALESAGLDGAEVVGWSEELAGQALANPQRSYSDFRDETKAAALVDEGIAGTLEPGMQSNLGCLDPVDPAAEVQEAFAASEAVAADAEPEAGGGSTGLSSVRDSTLSKDEIGSHFFAEP